MSDESRPTFLARLARRPAPIFLGLAVGFLGCCVAGRVAARQQPFKNFVRFHQGLTPESHYYPTFSQTLNLARQRVKPGTTMVLVGGNSVMHGVGQRAARVWTLELQRLLGDDYVVLNLAMRGQWPNEFGGSVADRLAADGVPLIYVTIGTPAVGWDCDWDGGVYKYFFWDGWGKGLVPPDPRRDQWLEEGFYKRFERAAPTVTARRSLAAAREQATELRRRGEIDGVTYAQDLWNYVADRYRATVWTPLKYPKFWRPHREMADTEPGSALPWDTFNNEDSVPTELVNIRAPLEAPTAKALLKGEQYAAVAEQFAAHVTDVLRPRTLYVMRLEGTYYRARLKPDEQVAYLDVYRRYAEAVRRGGLNAVVVGEGYEDTDYFDRAHLSERGGRKMAGELAPLIRSMNERLYGPGRTEGAKP